MEPEKYYLYMWDMDWEKGGWRDIVGIFPTIKKATEFFDEESERYQDPHGHIVHDHVIIWEI
jgi:hypothetical protein